MLITLSFYQVQRCTEYIPVDQVKKWIASDLPGTRHSIFGAIVNVKVIKADTEVGIFKFCRFSGKPKRIYHFRQGCSAIRKIVERFIGNLKNSITFQAAHL